MAYRFAPLHRHTCFSSYDGAGTPASGAQYAQAIGMAALAITDHGNMNGVMEHYLACKEVGIHPVVGVEGYLQPAFAPGKKSYHGTFLAENLTGYRNLCVLLTESAQGQFYRHPVFDFAQLERLSEGIIYLSGCVAGFIPRLILQGNMAKATLAARWFKRVFGDRFYLEVQPFSVLEHGRDIQKEVNKGLLILSQQLHIPCVLTTDTHYVEPDSYDTYCFMWTLANAGKGKEMKADYTHLHLKRADDVAAAWQTLMGSDPSVFMERSVEIAQRCQVDLSFTDMVPRFDWGMPSRQKLAELAKNGLKEKGKWIPSYRERLLEEFAVICDTGFEDYFLLVWDIVSFARRRGILCEARGSACSSLLAYALGITNVDAVKLETYFERFMRRDKHVLPDIDVDFDSERRDEVHAYVLDKYRGQAAFISNYGVFSLKNLVNDIAKKYAISDNEREELKGKLLAVGYEDHPLTYERLLAHAKYGTWFQTFDEAYEKFLLHFTRLFGQVRYIGRHAAGIAITSGELGSYVPLIRTGETLQTAYDMDGLSAAGILKMDLLGVKMLSVQHELEKLTGETFREDLLDKPELYVEFAAGRTDGIFQFSGGGIRGKLTEIQPQNFDELCAVNALYRPGAMKSIPAYCAAKFGGMVDTTTPWYEYTKGTYGVLVYDEQKMFIARNLGRLSWDDTDRLMKQAKKGFIDERLRAKFVEGATAQGMTQGEALRLIQILSLYTFNKAHATGYTQVAVYCMYLRQQYPQLYYATMLAHEQDDTERWRLEMAAVLAEQVVLLPHVNGPAVYAVQEFGGEPVIRAGLSTIPHVGELSARTIARYAPYTSERDLLEKIPPQERRHVNKRVLEALKKAGALDFNDGQYIRRCTQYCSALYTRGMR